jgi:hypothetical protein
MKKGFLLFLILQVFNSCIDKVDLKDSATTPKLIVDGIITDQPGPYSVKLSYSVPYSSDSLTRPVEKAQVTILEVGGKSANLTEIEPGFYRTDTLAIRGVVGKSYFVRIRTADGKTYESKPEQILPPLPIDTFYTRFVGIQNVLNDQETDFFEIFIRAKDPAAQRNYYRWKWIHYEKLTFCRNRLTQNGAGRFLIRNRCCTDCWRIEPCSDCINIADDELSDGKFIDKRIGTAPYTSTDPFYMLLEQYAITYEYHRFWQNASSQIFNTGGIFDSPPIQVQGNVANINDANEQVAGYFAAAGLTVRPVYIDRSNTGKLPPDPNPFDVTEIIESACFECAGLYRTRTKPPAWR